jgi:transposase
MKSLTAAQQTYILSLLDKGQSAHKVSSTTGIHTSTISRLRSKHRSTLSKSKGGRPSKLSPSNIHYAIRLITSQKAENAAEVTKTLEDITNQPLSSKTVRRGLKAAGMKAVVKKKRPLLSRRHRRNRLDFALAHKDWTLDDWKRVIWSDETKINRLGSDGRKWVWKKAGEGLSDRLIEGTVKFGGGSVMVWGCMFWDGPGYACKIDGRMDGDLYVKIMEEDLKASMDYYGKNPQNVVFQQDNDPKHTCKKAKTWFQNSNLEVMEWPAQSPDLNPIEHLWSHLKKKLGEYENPPTGITELWERVEKEWNDIPTSVCQNLIESMPRRVSAVLSAKGGYTKY